MSASNNPDEFYAKLKTQLQDTAMWPSEYLYKFIVPSKEDLKKEPTPVYL